MTMLCHVTTQWQLLILKTKDPQFDKFVVTGGTVICHNDNLQCHQWWQCCQIDDLLFSVKISHVGPMTIRSKRWQPYYWKCVSNNFIDICQDSTYIHDHNNNILMNSLFIHANLQQITINIPNVRDHQDKTFSHHMHVFAMLFIHYHIWLNRMYPMWQFNQGFNDRRVFLNKEL